MKAVFQDSGLLRCPTEIHCMIFKFLSTKDFYGLFWTCKILNRISEPFMYCEIQLNWRKHSRPPRIISLIKNILSRPYLAIGVTGLTLGRSGGESMRSIATIRDIRLTVDETDLEQLIEVIKTFGIDYEDIWIGQLRNRNMDAFVAILLCKLPNLIYFQLNPNFSYDSEIIGLVLRSTVSQDGNCGIASFKQLQHVTFKQITIGRFGRGTLNPQDILPFFSFPNIVCLSATIDAPADYGWPLDSRPVASTVTSLDLDMAKAGMLYHILSVTTRLRTLRWRWHHYGNSGTTIRYDVIMGALSLVQNTLTNLTISAENEVVNAYSSWIGVTGSLDGLVNFNFLKRLEINLEFLLGSISSPNARLRIFPPSGRTLQFERIVPQSIEVLTLTDDKELEWQNYVHYHKVATAIQSWLGAWETSTPHLRSIRFLLMYDYQEFDSTPTRNLYKLDRTMRMHLDRLSAATGVEIEVRRIYRTDL
ncbi:uncharacterized protein Bfra_005723 [Botrytis fragariae]|uniref:F-box domain-containing protein n=1 Tax=Botrytis fragariae TaxID=1964551 RepID=A0A8H6ARM4_9HELO|nr:uncharacterized protein Bfra_005723 [Botrytis fragariae]KAF5872364.1 hypothetical protein Bfra_005723 [Botrytis fragariae]